VEPWCDAPETMLTLKTIYSDADGRNALTISTMRIHKRLALIKLEGVDSIPEAEEFRGRILFADRRNIPVPDGGWLIQDLLGAAVFHADTGKTLGTLCEVSTTGANDVWHIEKHGKIALVPAVDEVVVNVDIEAGRIELRPIPGMMEEVDNED